LSTIVLHWIIERGDDGIDAVLANQSKQMKGWLQKARNTSLEVPQAISEEITESFTGIDETKAASIFSDICRQVDCEDLYVVYGIQRQTVHPIEARPVLPGYHPISPPRQGNAARSGRNRRKRKK
jgi:hypothetical protein